MHHFKKILGIESKFINFLYKWKTSFLIFVIIVHLGLFAWEHPDIVSSAFFWVITIIFSFSFGYQNVKKLYVWLFSLGKNQEITKRLLLYLPIISIPLHCLTFKPSSKFLSIFKNNNGQ